MKEKKWNRKERRIKESERKKERKRGKHIIFDLIQYLYILKILFSREFLASLKPNQ